MLDGGTIALNNIISGGVALLPNAGAPVAGTDEVQTLTFGGTWLAGDTFKLRFSGRETAAIAWSATNATLVANIDAALEALANVGTGGVTTAVGTMTAGIGTITLTSAGNLAKLSHSTFEVRSVVSAAGTLAIAVTTPGVSATGHGAGIGALLADTTNGDLYQNTTTPVPTWGLVAVET